MGVFTVLFYCLFVGVITAAFPDLRSSSSYIVGGELAEIQDAPYQAALLYFGMLFCGGSILTPRAVISAAHCVVGRDPSVVNVRVGSTNNDRGGQVVSLSRAIYHRKFNSKEMDYDVSLLFLSETLKIDNFLIATVAIAPQDSVVPDNALAVTSGWGSLQEGGVLVTALRKVSIPIVNQEECKRVYSGSGFPVTDRMICAGAPGKDACQGDSGGPLVRDRVLIGLTSWGIGCARPGYPGVWTRVAAVSSWINDQLKMATGKHRSYSALWDQNNDYIAVL